MPSGPSPCAKRENGCDNASLDCGPSVLSHDTGTRAVVVVAVVQVQVGGLACGSVRWVGAAGGRGGGEGERELARVLLLFRVWRWWDRSDAFFGLPECRALRIFLVEL